MKFKTKVILVLIVIGIIILIRTATGAVVWDNTVYFNFEDGTGFNLTDIVAGLNNGTLNDIGDDASWGSPKLGDFGLIFNGTKGHINVTDSSSIDLPIGSISVWINVSSNTTNDMWIYTKGEGDGNSQNFELKYDGSPVTTGLRCGVGTGAGSAGVAGGALSLGGYHNVICTWNSTNVEIWVDGVVTRQAHALTIATNNINMTIGRQRADGTGDYYNGTMDEMGIWDRVLSANEVSGIYNDGNGQIFNTNPSSIVVTLDSPANGTRDTEVPLEFTTTGVCTECNLTNATILIWNSTFDEVNRTVIILNGTTNTTAFNISNLPLDTAHVWNIEFCAVNSTVNNICNTATSNRTFNNAYNILIEDWTNITTESASSRFELNLTIPASVQISTATLIYNNTEFSGSFIQTQGNNFSLSRTITIPNVEGDVNKSFIWDIKYDNGFAFNSTNHTQSVKSLSLDSCGTNTILILNYTLRDEEDQSILNGTLENSTIELDLDLFTLGASTPTIQFSQNYTKLNPAQVCIIDGALNNTDFRLDVLTRYQSSNRVSEFHNIQNFTLTNSVIPQNINLFDLKTVDSQEFLITFKDENFLPVQGALIDITRNYIDEGTFKSVEVPKTDSDGQTIGHLVLSDVIYTLIVSKNGNTLGTFENVIAFCDNQAIGDCKINLNAFSTTTEPKDFTTVGDVTYSFNFNRGTRTIRALFTTNDGSTKTLQLNATLFDNYGNTTVCSNSLTSSSGTLTCFIPDSVGNETVFSVLYSNGLPIASAIFRLGDSPEEIFGGTRVFIAIMLFMTIPLMFITSPIGLVIGGILALIFSGILLIIDNGALFSQSSIIMYFIIAGAILIWKINSRSKE